MFKWKEKIFKPEYFARLIFLALFLSITLLAQNKVAMANSATLSWTAPTTNGDGSPLTDLAGYKIYVGTASLVYGEPPIDAGTPAGNPLTYTVNNLGTGTYYFAITTYNSSGLESSYSNEVSKTFSSVVDTTPPTTPSNLSASAASSSQINLTWTASTDNVGVTGYMVERCQGADCSNFIQIAAPSGTSYNDLGLAASTTYSYRVRATDLAGNLSVYSNLATATTNVPSSGGAPDPTRPPVTPITPNLAAQQTPPGSTGGCGMIIPKDEKSSKPEQAVDMLVIIGLIIFSLIRKMLHEKGFKMINLY